MILWTLLVVSESIKRMQPFARLPVNMLLRSKQENVLTRLLVREMISLRAISLEMGLVGALLLIGSPAAPFNSGCTGAYENYGGMCSSKCRVDNSRGKGPCRESKSKV